MKKLIKIIKTIIIKITTTKKRKKATSLIKIKKIMIKI